MSPGPEPRAVSPGPEPGAVGGGPDERGGVSPGPEPGAVGGGPERGAAGGTPDPGSMTSWYRAHARDLPWREPGTTPWGVLVSEVMSQQTPVARVAPAWKVWMERWPSPAALAQAETAEVLRAWGRLGYPRRALRLVECARAVVEHHGGELPQDLEELKGLPGIGEYTAGAVMAFAFGRRALTLDTNVRRVLARAVGGQALPEPSLSQAERRRADALLPRGDIEASAWSAAVMELGALVCTAKEPRCEQCPWRESCAWVAAGRPADAHAHRRRVQAWHGTDRQARGLVMARLRAQAPGRALARELLETEAARAGTRSGKSGAGAQSAAGGAGSRSEKNGAGRRQGKSDTDAQSGAGGDPQQPSRVLAGLLADGLVATDDDGATFRLP